MGFFQNIGEERSPLYIKKLNIIDRLEKIYKISFKPGASLVDINLDFDNYVIWSLRRVKDTDLDIYAPCVSCYKGLYLYAVKETYIHDPTNKYVITYKGTTVLTIRKFEEGDKVGTENEIIITNGDIELLNDKYIDRFYKKLDKWIKFAEGGYKYNIDYIWFRICEFFISYEKHKRFYKILR